MTSPDVDGFVEAVSRLTERAAETEPPTDLHAELGTALEELHVAKERLITQNEELERLRRLSEDDRAHYQRLFLDAPLPALVTDERGVVREANERAAEVLERRLGGLVGKPLPVLTAPVHRAELRTRLGEVVSTGRMSRCTITFSLGGDRERVLDASVACLPSAGTLLWSLRPVPPTGPEATDAAPRPVHSGLPELVGDLLSASPPEASARLARVVGDASDAPTAVVWADEGKRRTTAASGPLAENLVGIDVADEVGPLSEALARGVAVVETDLTSHSERWPVWAAAALANDVRSIHVFPVSDGHEAVAAVAILGSEPGAHPGAAQARAIVEIADRALPQRRTLEHRRGVISQLQHALDSRVVIEQAKGLLAATGGLPVDDTFERIRAYARNRGARVQDVASSLVEGKLEPRTLLYD